MTDFSRFEFLSFDCYGTLINWAPGIAGAIHPVLHAHGLEASDEEILDAYTIAERDLERDYRPYREVLTLAMRSVCRQFGFEANDREANAILDSLGHWEPFPDTVAALQRLARKYKLVVISNIDQDLFALTAPKLGVPFAQVVTAQQVGSYKPSLNNFRKAQERMGVGNDRHFHAARSLFHDIVPCNQLGITCVWVNRGSGQQPPEEAPAPVPHPDAEVTNLTELADLVAT